MGNDLKSLLTVVATTAMLLTPATTGRAGSISADAPKVTTVNPGGACGEAGSSNATFDSNNHRMVVTRGGRKLVAYDPHGSGVDLAWKDPGEDWEEKSVFDNGPDEEPNDRPASIALDGAGHAWVVWSGHSKRFGPVKMRRLTNLHASNGPTVGPAMTVKGGDAVSGNAAVDLAFQDGRGHIIWLQRTGTHYSLTTVSFTDLGDPTPRLLDRTTLGTSSSKQTSATLVPTRAGMRAVARVGKLRLFRYRTSGWTPGSAETGARARARPSAVAFKGDVLAAWQSSSNPGAVTVARFSNNGDSVRTSLSTADGYVEPAIAASGSKAWVIMVRASGKSVVSRTFNGSSWGGDATLMTSDDGHGNGEFTWPNTLREVRGTLRFLVGQRCTQTGRKQRSAVLSFERNLDTTAPQTRITNNPPRRTKARKARFAFRADEKRSTFKCKRDRGQFKPCSSPKVYRGLKPGRHTFKVRAKDRAGNVDPTPAVWRWRVRRR